MASSNVFVALVVMFLNLYLFAKLTPENGFVRRSSSPIKRTVTLCAEDGKESQCAIGERCPAVEVGEMVDACRNTNGSRVDLLLVIGFVCSFFSLFLTFMSVSSAGGGQSSSTAGGSSTGPGGPASGIPGNTGMEKVSALMTMISFAASAMAYVIFQQGAGKKRDPDSTDLCYDDKFSTELEQVPGMQGKDKLCQCTGTKAGQSIFYSEVKPKGFFCMPAGQTETDKVEAENMAVTAQAAYNGSR